MPKANAELYPKSLILNAGLISLPTYLIGLLLGAAGHSDHPFPCFSIFAFLSDGVTLEFDTTL